MEYLASQRFRLLDISPSISSMFRSNGYKPKLEDTAPRSDKRIGKRSTIFKLLTSGNPVIALLIVLLCSTQSFDSAYARHNSTHPLTNEEWQEVMAKVSLLDHAVLIPSLLPVIMTNRDALELTTEQLGRFYHWRKENYVNMVNLMNEVIEKRVQFRIDSLTSAINETQLIAFQQEIHHLEEDLLRLRLTCRAIVMETFTPEQWETLEFLVADDPKLGSLISQRTSLQTTDN